MTSCSEKCHVCTGPDAGCLSSCSNLNNLGLEQATDIQSQWRFIACLLVLLPGLLIYWIVQLRRGGCNCNKQAVAVFTNNDGEEEEEEEQVGDDAEEDKVLNFYVCAVDASDEASHIPLVLGNARRILKHSDATKILDAIGKTVVSRLNLGKKEYQEESILFVKPAADLDSKAEPIYKYDPTGIHSALPGEEHMPMSNNLVVGVLVEHDNYNKLKKHLRDAAAKEKTILKQKKEEALSMPQKVEDNNSNITGALTAIVGGEGAVGEQKGGEHEDDDEDEDEDIEEASNNYVEQQDSASEWVREMCTTGVKIDDNIILKKSTVKNMKHITPRGDLYDPYSEWCEEAGKPAMNKPDFLKQMVEIQSKFGFLFKRSNGIKVFGLRIDEIIPINTPSSIEDINLWAVAAGNLSGKNMSTVAYLRPYFRSEENSIVGSVLMQYAMVSILLGFLLEIHVKETFGIGVGVGFVCAAVLFFLTEFTTNRHDSDPLHDDESTEAMLGSSTLNTKISPVTVATATAAVAASSFKHRDVCSKMEHNKWSIKCDIFVKCLVAICCVILSWTVAYGSYGDFQNIILDGSDTITIFPEGCEVSIEPIENGGLFPSLTLWEPRFNTLAPSTLRISEESTKVYVVTRRDGTFVNSTINDGRMSLSSSISSAPTKNASTSEVLADAAGVNREDGSGGLKCRVSVNVPANSQLKHVRIIQEGSGSSAVVKIKKTSIASLLVSVPESSTQLLINDARIENMTVHTTKLHVRMDQVELVSSVHLLSSTLVGYADVLVRGDDGTMTVIEEVNHASNFKTCLRGGTLVAGVRTTTEQRYYLAPSKSFLTNETWGKSSGTMFRLSNVMDGNFVVSTSEGLCDGAPTILTSIASPYNIKNPGLAEEDIIRVKNEMDKNDILDLTVHGFGRAKGTFFIAPSLAWLSFSSSFLYAFSLSKCRCNISACAILFCFNCAIKLLTLLFTFCLPLRSFITRHFGAASLPVTYIL